MLTVTDDNDSVAVDTTWALIRESNDPPSAPSIDGETEGNYGEPYDYAFLATDTDGDDVWYYIEWGDGEFTDWIGPFASGEEVVLSHTWDEQDTYTIKAKAKDVYDAESEWGTLEIEMPISYNLPFFQFFKRVIEHFPILEWLISFTTFNY